MLAAQKTGTYVFDRYDNRGWCKLQSERLAQFEIRTCGGALVDVVGWRWFIGGLHVIDEG